MVPNYIMATRCCIQIHPHNILPILKDTKKKLEIYMFKEDPRETHSKEVYIYITKGFEYKINVMNIFSNFNGYY